MTRIIYYCPATNHPTGGIKVIYKHVEALNSNGIESYVLHPILGFKCSWFESQAKIFTEKKLKSDDHLIIPEGDPILNFGEKLLTSGINYSIFCQNGYNIPSGENYKENNLIDRVYKNAKLILCVSEDTASIVSLYYPECSIKTRIIRPSIKEGFKPRPKRKIISYMPRKNKKHVQNVIFSLRNNLPSDWSLQEIQDASESLVIQKLGESSIFLSFSDFEGLGLPPIEAALSGNFVVGYHGNGGKEYWDPIIFKEVTPYNVKEFQEKTIELIKSINEEKIKSTNPSFIEAKNKISEKYNIMQEETSLLSIAKEITAYSTSKHPQELIWQKKRIYFRLEKLRKSIKKRFLKEQTQS